MCNLEFPRFINVPNIFSLVTQNLITWKVCGLELPGFLSIATSSFGNRTNTNWRDSLTGPQVIFQSFCLSVFFIFMFLVILYLSSCLSLCLLIFESFFFVYVGICLSARLCYNLSDILCLYFCVSVPHFHSVYLSCCPFIVLSSCPSAHLSFFYLLPFYLYIFLFLCIFIFVCMFVGHVIIIKIHCKLKWTKFVLPLTGKSDNNLSVSLSLCLSVSVFFSVSMLECFWSELLKIKC